MGHKDSNVSIIYLIGNRIFRMISNKLVCTPRIFIYQVDIFFVDLFP